jgi:superfamily II DNA or RNA helicase
MEIVKGAWALIPKGALNYRILTSLCSHKYTDGRMVVEIEDGGEYWICPREIFTDRQFEALGLDVLRLRPSSFRPAFVDLPKSVSHTNAKSERAQRIQVQALDILLELRGGVIEVPPGTGKTALAFQAMQEFKVPTIVCVHTTNLQQQWVEKAQQMLGMNRSQIGIVGGGHKWEYEGKDLVVALVQSLSKHETKSQLMGSEFGLIVYDEVHHMQGIQFRHALPICSGIRIGLSATVEKGGLEKLFLNHIGPVVYRSEETDLDPKILIVRTHAQLSQAAIGRIAVGARINEDAERAWTMNEVGQSRINDTIVHYVEKMRDEGRTQLLLSDRLDQLQILHHRIEGSSLLIGDTPNTERAKALYDSKIVCASASIATEGLDRPELDTLHVCLPWSGRARFVQGGGRILRNFPDKKEPLIIAYDPVDVPIMTNTLKGFKQVVNRYGYKKTEEQYG